MKNLLLFTVLFLSINTSIQGSVCDKVCFDELREHFSRFAGYSTFTKRFKGPRFWTWKEEEAYVDAKTDEGKKRRQEFDDGFERAELRSDKEYCRSNGLEEAREKVVGELRESDARKHALDMLCGDDSDERDGTIEKTDRRAACVFVLRLCDEWQARGGMGEGCPDRRANEDDKALTGDARRELTEESRDKDEFARDKFLHNNKNFRVRGIDDHGVIAAADNVDNVRNQERECLRDAQQNMENRRAFLEWKNPGNVDRIHPLYSPPDNCRLVPSRENPTACQCK